MKATIRDIDTLRAIQPLQVVSYLRVNGWTQAQQIPGGAFWTKEGGQDGHELLLPTDSNLRDFPNRIADVLAELEGAENRSQLDILEDLIITGADLVRPRLLGVDHGDDISLEQGRIVHSEARNMMLAAACAALAKQPLFANRKPEKAMAFLEHARFGMPKRGSYILTIISPVSPRLHAGQDFFEDEIPDEPFERQTMRTLAEAIVALEVGCREVAVTSDIEPIKRAVQAGVSANLCEALVGLNAVSEEKGVEFSFSWAPLRSTPVGTPRHAKFTPDFFPIIKEVARVFRDTEAVKGIPVLGVVNRLEHRDGTYGKVTILGSVDGEARTVSLELSGENHALAIRSYEDRLTFSCVGDLAREGKSWVLRNPRDISLISDSQV